MLYYVQFHSLYHSEEVLANVLLETDAEVGIAMDRDFGHAKPV